MMRIYQSLEEKLLAMHLFNHIDLWNQNVEFIDQESPFAMPACFVEFGRVMWEDNTNGQRGSVDVSLHCVTAWNNDREHINTTQTLFERLHNTLIDGERLRRVSSIVNHNHDQIIDSIEVYRLKVSR